MSRGSPRDRGAEQPEIREQEQPQEEKSRHLLYIFGRDIHLRLMGRGGGREIG
jgi:hypothetical protein